MLCLSLLLIRGVFVRWQLDKHERLINEDWKVLRPSSKIRIRVAPGANPNKGTPLDEMTRFRVQTRRVHNCLYGYFRVPVSRTRMELRRHWLICSFGRVCAESTAAAAAASQEQWKPAAPSARAPPAARLAERALTEPLLRVTVGSHTSRCDALFAAIKFLPCKFRYLIANYY